MTMWRTSMQFFAPDDAGSGSEQDPNAVPTPTKGEGEASGADEGQGGATGGEGDGGADKQNAPQFDPSKVNLDDVEALAQLTDEQFKLVEEYEKTKTGAAPEGESDKDTSSKETAAESTVASAEKTDAAGKYAGKYASTDDLVKGVTEIAGKLGYPKDALQAVLDIAKETNDFKTVEALYKRFEKQLSEHGAATTQEATTGPASAPAQAETVDLDTLRKDPEVANAVTQLTMTQLAGSNLAKRFEAKGIALPKNMEEFEALTEVNSYLAMQFETAFKELYHENLKEAGKYIEAERSVEPANAKIVDSDTQAIKAFAEKHGFTVSEEELNAVRGTALGMPQNFDTRYGHKFLRQGALMDTFSSVFLSKKLAEIGIAKNLEGRRQVIDDLKRAAEKESSTVSTSRITTKTRAIPKTPDLNDPDVVRQLPDEALEDPEGFFKSFRK